MFFLHYGGGLDDSVAYFCPKIQKHGSRRIIDHLLTGTVSQWVEGWSGPELHKYIHHLTELTTP